MYQFKSYLIESANEEKLKHLEHAEDHPINAGEEGFKHAFNTLHGVHEALKGKKSPVSLSQKYDGSPSLVFGHNPENGKFFVTTKSAFNKNPKLNYTEKDIEENHGHAPGLVSKLKESLKHLPKVVPAHGVFQGDMMYSKKDKDVTTKGGSHSFKPNTITYSTPANSEEGQKIAKAKIGVAVHTAYHGNTMEGLKAQYNTDLAGFGEHPDVHIISARQELHNSPYGEAEENQFTSHMKKAVALHGTLGKYDHLNGHQDHIKTYINKTVRDEVTPTVEGYKAHLTALHQKEADKLKTPAAKQAKLDKGEALVKHVEANKKAFANTFAMHHELQQAKNVLVHSIANTKGPYTTTVNGQAVKPEGAVAVLNNRPTKLVDRSEFSRLNFAARPR